MVEKEKRNKDLTGEKFGKLEVLYKMKTLGMKYFWVCACDCGNTVKVRGGNLKSGRTKSCGCLRREILKELKSKKNGG